MSFETISFVCSSVADPNPDSGSVGAVPMFLAFWIRMH